MDWERVDGMNEVVIAASASCSENFGLEPSARIGKSTTNGISVI